MELVLSEDQKQFQDVLSKFFKANWSIEQVRKVYHDPLNNFSSVWKMVSEELALTGIIFPESLGGAEAGMAELSLVAQAMGKSLYSGPYFPSIVLCGLAIQACNDSNLSEQFLPELISGKTAMIPVVSGLGEPGRSKNSYTQSKNNIQIEEGMVISGSCSLAFYLPNAEWILVLEKQDDGSDILCILSTKQNKDQIKITPIDGMDATRPICQITFDKAVANYCTKVPQNMSAGLWHRWLCFGANELIGSADYLLESTIDFMNNRFQFGRSVGSFQGLKHKIADFYCQLEVARSLAWQSARVLDGSPGNSSICFAANALATEAASAIARIAIQFRGGMGFTWEEGTHFWFRRIKTSEALFGFPEANLQIYAEDSLRTGSD